MIQSDYSWDLTKFCVSDKVWHERVVQLEAYIPQFLSFKDKLNTPTTLLEFFQLEEKVSALLSPLELYASCHSDADLSNSAYVEMENILSGIETKIEVATAFVAPELLRYPSKYLEKLIADERFQNYAFGLARLNRNRPHILSEPEEKILSQTGAFAGEFEKIFHALSDANLHFNAVKDSAGKEHELTVANYTTLLMNQDRVLRKNAYEELYAKFDQFSDTISANYIASLKSDWFYAQTAKFENTLQSHLFPDAIADTVYNKLIENVTQYTPLLHSYFSLKSNLIGVPDFTYYDLFLSPVKLKRKYTFEQAMDTVLKGLLPLGEDYQELLKRSVKERWIDVFPALNKRSGAYQTGCYGISPVVLLNFMGTTDDVFTIAHELGHAMHTHYANSANPRSLAGYTIFLAEIASTTNEVLLLKYLYSQAKTREEKLFYLDHYLQMFKSTIFRQTMFSDFENYAHGLVERNEPISKNVLSNYYGELNKKYQGKAVKFSKQIAWEWLRIPHFYTAYYVYKYATGLVSAICLASAIYQKQPHALENYKRFLQSGGKDYSPYILEQAGVDLKTDEPYRVAFSEMEWALSEWKKLV